MFILQLHPESQIQAKHLQSCTCSFFFLQRALQNLENSSQPNVQKPTSSFPGGRPSNPNEIDREGRTKGDDFPTNQWTSCWMNNPA